MSVYIKTTNIKDKSRMVVEAKSGFLGEGDDPNKSKATCFRVHVHNSFSDPKRGDPRDLHPASLLCCIGTL